MPITTTIAKAKKANKNNVKSIAKPALAVNLQSTPAIVPPVTEPIAAAVNAAVAAMPATATQAEKQAKANETAAHIAYLYANAGAFYTGASKTFHSHTPGKLADRIARLITPGHVTANFSDRDESLLAVLFLESDKSNGRVSDLTARCADLGAISRAGTHNPPHVAYTADTGFMLTARGISAALGIVAKHKAASDLKLKLNSELATAEAIAASHIPA